MASAAPPKPRKTCVSGDATQSTSSDGSNTSAGNSSGAITKKPKPKGKVVKSRYMMVPDKKPAAKNAVMNQSICVPNRPGTPTKLGTPTKPSTPSRRSEPPRLYKIPSKLQSNVLDATRIGKNELQSTLLEGHSILPELDISVINDKTVHKPSEPQDMDLEHAIDNQTWLLTCLTVLMERNTTRLKEEAERSLLAVMEEEENLRRKVQEQKRQLRLWQKEKELDSLLDLQIAALTPLAAAAEKFKQEYKTFATALDTTRHELPVKNIHIEGDRQAFLDKAAVCLKETEKLLSELNPAAAEESDRACELLKAVKDTTRSVDEELGRVFTEVLELSSLVSRETVLIHQRSAEESTGLAVARDLYIPTDY